MIFESEYKYIESCTTTQGKLDAVRAIIDALLLTAAKAATNDHIEEYWLNDGQTQIKTIYKGADKVYKSIEAFKRLEQEYMNRLHGRVMRAIDGSNLTGNGSYR